MSERKKGASSLGLMTRPKPPFANNTQNIHSWLRFLLRNTDLKMHLLEWKEIFWRELDLGNE